MISWPRPEEWFRPLPPLPLPQCCQRYPPGAAALVFIFYGNEPVLLRADDHVNRITRATLQRDNLLGLLLNLVLYTVILKLQDILLSREDEDRSSCCYICSTTIKSTSLCVTSTSLKLLMYYPRLMPTVGGYNCHRQNSLCSLSVPDSPLWNAYYTWRSTKQMIIPNL